MDQSLVRKSVIGGAIGAAIALVAGTLRKRQPRTQHDGWGVIFFFGTGSERVAKVFPEVIRARRNGKVDWYIGEFSAQGAGDIAIDWSSGDPTTGVIHDKPNKKLKGRVKGNASYGRYSYRVKENGSVVADPDVEIMM